MANAIRNICSKIGNGHQYLLGTAKTSAYGSHLATETVQQHLTELLAENKCKLNRADNLFHWSQPSLHYHGYHKELSKSASVEWFNRRDRYLNVKHTVEPLTNLNSTLPKPDDSYKSNNTNNNNTPNAKGLPSTEQLDFVYDRLGDNLPKMFKENLDYSLFHPKLIFENNIRGTKTVGLEYFMTTISVLRLMGHIKYAFVKFDILKITKHPEDGTIKVRWRIKGISGMKVFMKFWKFKLFNFEQIIKENVESWHDGFSVLYLGSDGLIHKLTADKMQPDNDPVVEDKITLGTKLALFLGLSPQLNNLDCLMTFETAQTNELLKMVILSLEDVI